MFSTIINTITRKLTPPTCQPLSIEEVYPCLVGQRERNEARIKTIIEGMGDKWVLSPKHKTKRLKIKRPV